MLLGQQVKSMGADKAILGWLMRMLLDMINQELRLEPSLGGISLDLLRPS